MIHLTFLHLCKKRPPPTFLVTPQLLFPLVNNSENHWQKLCKKSLSLLILQGNCNELELEKAEKEDQQQISSDKVWYTIKLNKKRNYAITYF